MSQPASPALPGVITDASPAHARCASTSVLSVSGPSSARECDLLVLWTRPNRHGKTPRTVEICGEITRWDRVSLIRVDEVTRGTYFHLTLNRMPVGLRLRVKFVVDGEYTVDDRYETEDDDGYGDKNNVFYIDPKSVRRREATFPVAVPFVGAALRAANPTLLPEAHLPQEMITSTRLYHSYRHMQEIKREHPEKEWAEVRQMAKERGTKANRMSEKKKHRLARKKARDAGMLSTVSSMPPGFSALLPGTSSASLTAGAGGTRVSHGSSTGSMPSFAKGLSGLRRSLPATASSSAAERGATGGRGHRAQRSRGAQTLSSSSPPRQFPLPRRRRPKPKTQAGTLSMCQGLSIYELEGRVQAVLQKSRALAHR